jgi:hypothetical protein
VIKIKILAVGCMARVFMFLQFVASFLVLDSTEKSRKGGRVEEHNWICQIAIWNSRIGYRRH